MKEIVYLVGQISPKFEVTYQWRKNVIDYFREYFKGDGELYEAITMELIHRGVQPDGDAREPWFLCYALSEEDVSETLNVFNDAVKAAKG